MATVTNVSSETFFSEMKRITSTLIWKNESLAKGLEVPTDSYNRDMFMAASRGDIRFEGIPSIPKQVLLNSGIIGQEQIDACLANKENVPYYLRENIAEIYTQYIINTYEEKNDYYRMLNGLPMYSEFEFFYCIDKSDTETLNNLTPFTHIAFHEDIYVYFINGDLVKDLNLTPLHELDDILLFRYEAYGILDKIREFAKSKNMGKRAEYLDHLTKYKIDLFTSRASDGFELLFLETSSPENLSDDFRESYDLAKDYIRRVYYTDAFRSNNDYYIPFIGMCILFMALQQMCYKYLEADYTREFYDLESLRVIYDSYGVPFLEDIPLKYHKEIVRRINALISYKGSDQVLIDLLGIFDFHKVDIYQYYLVKKHKFDEDGNPVFALASDKILDNGKPDYDYEQMYDYFFTEAEIGCDPYSEIRDTSNRVTYDEITVPDEFWIEDDQLIRKLYESEFNYIETKYFGIAVVFDMTKLVYESCYYFRMIQDNRNRTGSKITIYHDYIQDDVPLFDFLIYTICLICKSNGYIDPETGQVIAAIPYKPTEVAKMYAFNFKEDLLKIQEDIKANPLLDNMICDMIKDMNVYNKEDVDKVYSNIDQLLDFLNYKIETCTDVKTYEAYYELRKTLLTAEGIKEIYTKEDGEIATGYSDLLKDTNGQLHDRLYDDNVVITDEIDFCLSALKKYAKALEQLDTSADFSKLKLIKFLRKIITFFKSAKIDITGFKIIYLLGSRSTDLIKFFMELHNKISIHWLHEAVDLAFNDIIYGKLRQRFGDSLKLHDILILFMRFTTLNDYWLSDYYWNKAWWNTDTRLDLKDFIVFCENLIKKTDYFKFKEKYTSITSPLNKEDEIYFYDKVIFELCSYIYNIHDRVDIKDYITAIDIIVPNINSTITFEDMFHIFASCTTKGDTIHFLDLVNKYMTINEDSKLTLKDFIIDNTNTTYDYDIILIYETLEAIFAEGTKYKDTINWVDYYERIQSDHNFFNERLFKEFIIDLKKSLIQNIEIEFEDKLDVLYKANPKSDMILKDDSSITEVKVALREYSSALKDFIINICDNYENSDNLIIEDKYVNLHTMVERSSIIFDMKESYKIIKGFIDSNIHLLKDYISYMRTYMITNITIGFEDKIDHIFNPKTKSKLRFFDDSHMTKSETVIKTRNALKDYIFNINDYKYKENITFEDQVIDLLAYTARAKILFSDNIEHALESYISGLNSKYDLKDFIIQSSIYNHTPKESRLSFTDYLEKVK